MRCLIAILTLVCLVTQTVEGRSTHLDPVDPYIIGGTEATPGEFPWQLSLEKLVMSWSHICGASLLAENAALTAAHCVVVSNGFVQTLRVIAGLHLRSDQSIAQISAVVSYKTHENYTYTFETSAVPYDIAIITLVQPFTLGTNVALLTLPPDNSEQFVGTVCTLSGWGQTSSSTMHSDSLQKVDIPVISTEECNTNMYPIANAVCYDSQIAVYDVSNSKGSCDGDGGGPMNCPLGGGGGSVVAGLGSWYITKGDECVTANPSVYTRTGFYLDWIILNTPSS